MPVSKAPLVRTIQDPRDYPQTPFYLLGSTCKENALCRSVRTMPALRSDEINVKEGHVLTGGD